MESLEVSMPIKWSVCRNFKWRPETREGATLTPILVDKEQRLYMFGGLSRVLHSSMSYFLLNSRKCIVRFIDNS